MILILAWMLKDRDELLTEQIQLLRECIDVLFMFQRKPCKDDVFVRDTRSWLTRLVSIFDLFFYVMYCCNWLWHFWDLK